MAGMGREGSARRWVRGRDSGDLGVFDGDCSFFSFSFKLTRAETFLYTEEGFRCSEAGVMDRNGIRERERDVK